VAWLKREIRLDSEKVPVIPSAVGALVRSRVFMKVRSRRLELTASLSKRSSLSAVLKVLELSGVHCRLEREKN